jgi:prolyl-tRNA synthetase
MMGGKIAHEFMLLSEAGEDTLVLCGSCDLSSNMEVAECVTEPVGGTDGPLELVHTPNAKTIDSLCGFLSVPPEQTCKAVMYRKASDNGLVVVFIRGDLEVNETKLRNFIKDEIHADTSQQEDVTYGSCGPVNFTAKAALLFDRAVQGGAGMVTGANKEDYHYKGFSPGRDCPGAEYHDFAKTYEGAACPSCGKKSIIIRKGIEVGNIFQLGVKYSQTMGMEFADKDGAMKNPVMGCYGIGVGIRPDMASFDRAVAGAYLLCALRR